MSYIIYGNKKVKYERAKEHLTSFMPLNFLPDSPTKQCLCLSKEEEKS
jgi:hypothetical protein